MDDYSYLDGGLSGYNDFNPKSKIGRELTF